MLNNEAFKAEALKVGLRKMFEDSHFSICTLDSLAKMAGIVVPQDLQNSLHALHCVRWSAMSSEMRENIFARVLAIFSQDGLPLDMIDRTIGPPADETMGVLMLENLGEKPKESESPYEAIAAAVFEKMQAFKAQRKQGFLKRLLGGG